MQLLELQIRGFGKFQDLSLKLAPGINLIYGKNEAGKSTLHTFLRAMLFGLSGRSAVPGKRALYEQYEPWKTPESYGGSLRFLHEGKTYRLERDFARAADDLQITEEESGEKLAEPETFLSAALEGLTESAYLNTISIGQLRTAADRGIAADLKRYIDNLNTTGNLDLSAADALEYLKKKKAEIAERIQPEAAGSYARALSDIRHLEAELAKPENDNLLLRCAGQKDRVQTEIGALGEQLARVSAKLEKARAVLAENHFSDEASVRAYQSETEALSAAYRTGSERLQRKWSKLPAFFCLFCGIFFLAEAAYLAWMQGGAAFGIVVLLIGTKGITLDWYAVCLALGLAAACCGLFSFLCFRKRRKARKQLSETRARLCAVLQEQTGSDTPDAEAMEQFAARMDGFLKLCGAVSEGEAEKDALSRKLLSLTEEQNTCMEKLEEQRQIQSEVERKLGELNHCRNRAEEFRRVIAENQRLKEETDAISIAEETLHTLSAEIRSSVGTYVNREAGRLISGITGGVYGSLDVGSGTDIRVNTADGMVPVGSLSRGTMDQIYLALRLSAVRLVETEAGSLPLLFDDSFALYDDERLRHAVTFLAEYCRNQILIFTCHRREESILSKQEIPYNLISLPTDRQDFAE